MKFFPMGSYFAQNVFAQLNICLQNKVIAWHKFCVQWNIKERVVVVNLHNNEVYALKDSV